MFYGKPVGNRVFPLSTDVILISKQKDIRTGSIVDITNSTGLLAHIIWLNTEQDCFTLFMGNKEEDLIPAVRIEENSGLWYFNDLTAHLLFCAINFS